MFLEILEPFFFIPDLTFRPCPPLPKMARGFPSFFLLIKEGVFFSLYPHFVWSPHLCRFEISRSPIYVEAWLIAGLFREKDLFCFVPPTALWRQKPYLFPFFSSQFSFPVISGINVPIGSFPLSFGWAFPFSSIVPVFPCYRTSLWGSFFRLTEEGCWAQIPRGLFTSVVWGEKGPCRKSFPLPPFPYFRSFRPDFFSSLSRAPRCLPKPGCLYIVFCVGAPSGVSWFVVPIRPRPWH